MLKYLKNIDWPQIVGSAMLLFFLIAIAPTSSNQPPANYSESHKHTHHQREVVGTFFGIPSDAITAGATAVIAGFTIILVIVTNRQARLANDSIKLARDDFNATHRPWIPIIEATLDFGLRWVKENALFGLAIICKNTGNSPAQRVSLAVNIYPFLLNDDIPKELVKLQKAHRTSIERGLIERTLFPDMNPPLRLSRVVLIPEIEIKNLKDRYGEPATEMVPVILGAIEYYFPFGDGEPHYTPFVYHLWRTEKSEADRLTFKLDGTNVEADKILLVDLINAGNPN